MRKFQLILDIVMLICCAALIIQNIISKQIGEAIAWGNCLLWVVIAMLRNN